jgi:regulator of replication initiation timing
MNFSEAKSVFEAVTALVKTTATLDLQEKIVSLREYVISLKDENINLKEENHALKVQLSAQSDYELRAGLYWKEGEEIPYCQKCLDGAKKPIHLQKWSAEGWKCFECDKYYAPRGEGNAATVFRPEVRRRNPAV